MSCPEHPVPSGSPMDEWSSPTLDSYELRFFDGEGRFLHTSGRKGSGPGEFDGTMHLIPVSPDRFAVFVDPRLSMFDTSGNFLSATRIVSPDRESFPLPVWLYRRNWIEGPADSLNGRRSRGSWTGCRRFRRGLTASST